MSRRVITIIVVFLAALLIANIVILAIWLPTHKNTTGKLQTSNIVPAGSPAAPTVAAASSGDFVTERQLTSPSGNIQISYFRNPKTKMRRIAVGDAHRSGSSAVLYESKHNAWVLVSPDDQWIVVNERTGTDGGGARLYRGSGNSPVRYTVADGAGPEGRGLQDMVWQSYLNATHASPNTPRRGVTIDATNWENDSRRLNLLMSYLPMANNQDVPEPWRCTYDIMSKRVEPAPDQPPPGAKLADPSAENEADNQRGTGADQVSEQENTKGGQFADNAPGAEGDVAEYDAYPGERFPVTRLDELTVPDVNESSLSEITYAINEMFARHGAEFKDKKVTKQFEQFSWYKPRLGLSFDEIETEFSDLEKQNLKVLGRCRDAKLAAAKHKSRSVRGERVQEDEEPTGEKILRGIQTWQDLGGPMPPHP
jgi:hypothetical protein